MTDPKMPEPAAWIVFSGWHPVAVHLSSAGASADRDRRQMSDDLSGNLAAHRVAPAIFLAAAQAYAEALSAARVAQERERCAKLCEGIGDSNKWSDANACADAIRQQPPATSK